MEANVTQLVELHFFRCQSKKSLQNTSVLFHIYLPTVSLPTSFLNFEAHPRHNILSVNVKHFSPKLGPPSKNIVTIRLLQF